MSRKLENIYKSFPIQLLLLHFKQNQFLLLCWLILFLTINGGFAKGLGIPFLFLSPEYLDQVSLLSFFLVGLTLGGLIIAFNIASYILVGPNFHFLGAIDKPFARFSLNNAIIPIAFLVNYLAQVVNYQVYFELKPLSDALFYAFALPFGVAISMFSLQSYFWFTNKDLREVLAERVERKIRKIKMARIANVNRYKQSKAKQIEVSGYFTLRLKWVKVHERSSEFFGSLIYGIFNQNHLNTVIAEAFIFILILVLGAFRDHPIFQIPAAASAVLFLTIILMFIGAVSYWFRSWALTVSIVLFLIINSLVKTDMFAKTHYAYGINYNDEPASYSVEAIKKINTKAHIEEDKKRTLQTLNNWRNKFSYKPKLVLLSVSGGGQRSSYWTMHALQHLDSVTKGELFKHTVMISGASGGLIGAAYFRSLKWESQTVDSLRVTNKKYLDNIGKEALNPIIFSLLTNDVFIRYQTYDYNGYAYPKDRGYAFEQKLNRNLEGVLNKPLKAFREPEMRADIPLLFLSPTSVNDGRKIYVTPSSVSYMSENRMLDSISNEDASYRSIDFLRLFKNQDAENLSFLTALRMSASFPYITPNINLPSEPSLEIMDAGLADNFGVSDAVLFLNIFKDWIEKNTSGVIILSIRDSKKVNEIKQKENLSITEKIFTPITSVYNNWSNVQDIRNDLLVEYAEQWFKGDLNYYTLTYDANLYKDLTISKTQKQEERASLNWRLTEREKTNIRSAIKAKENVEVMNTLKNMLKPN
jgi:hypothetical protein